MIDEALEHLVKGIVAHPDEVSVRERNRRGGQGGPGRPGGGPTLEVRVHPEDMGRVIGKAGRTATALRTVLSALAGGKPVRVDFLDVDER